MDTSVRESLRAGTWLFLGSITVSLTGLIFWLIISRLSGAGSIGVASSVFSSAAIAGVLVSAGVNIGVMREVAARGPGAVPPGLMAALVLGAMASLLVVPLCLLLGFGGWLVLLASLYAGLNVVFVVLLGVLQGLAMFRRVFLVQVFSSFSKLVVGVGLALMGLGALAAVAGFTLYSIVGVFSGLALIMPLFHRGFDPRVFREILRLGYANYPFVASSQLVTALAVYLFAFLTGSPIDTGRLYISLMVAIAVSGLAGSVVAASLPIGTRSNSDPYGEAYRLAYGITLPVVVAVIPFSPQLLGLVNHDLVAAAPTLSLLLAFTPSLVMLSTIQARLNRYGRKRDLTLLGLLRLGLLIALGVAFSRIGTIGVAIAYTLSTLVPTIVGLKLVPGAAKTYTAYQAAPILPLALTIFGTPPVLASALALATTLVAQYLTGTMIPKDYIKTINEIINVTRLINPRGE